MAKKLTTFKQWKTGEVKTIEFRDASMPANPSSGVQWHGMRPSKSLKM